MSDLTQPPHVPSCVSTGEGVTVPTAPDFTAAATEHAALAKRVRAERNPPACRPPNMNEADAQRELTATATPMLTKYRRIEHYGDIYIEDLCREELESELSSAQAALTKAEARAECYKVEVERWTKWRQEQPWIPEMNGYQVQVAKLGAELAEAKAEVARLQFSITTGAIELTALRARVVELEQDKARLNWVIDNHNPWESADEPAHGHKAVRAAIDAARN